MQQPATKPVASPQPENTTKGKKFKHRGKPPKLEGNGSDGEYYRDSGRKKTKTAILVWRVSAWVALGMVFLLGLVSILVPASQPSIDTLTRKVADNINNVGFPVNAANAIALKYTGAYLNTDPNTADQKLTTLKSLSPSIENPAPSGVKRQKVTAGPYVTGKPERIDDNNYVLTTVTQVYSNSEYRWVTLQIPVFSSDGNTTTISGYPGVIPNAGVVNIPSYGFPENDDALSTDLTSNLYPGFFEEWSKGSSPNLDRWLSPDATINAKFGLNNGFIYESMLQAKVPTGGDQRWTLVEVTFTTGDGTKFTQAYRVLVSKQTDGRWFITDIRGAVVTPGSGDQPPDGTGFPVVSLNTETP
jgi:hypothetical protein